MHLLWESKFDGLLGLVKEYIVDVWEIRKHKLYDSDSGSGRQLHIQSSPGGVVSSFRMVSLVRMVNLVRMVSLVKIVCLVRKVKVHLGPNVSSSAHDCGRVVDGGGTMAAIIIIIIIIIITMHVPCPSSFLECSTPRIITVVATTSAISTTTQAPYFPWSGPTSTRVVTRTTTVNRSSSTCATTSFETEQKPRELKEEELEVEKGREEGEVEEGGRRVTEGGGRERQEAKGEKGLVVEMRGRTIKERRKDNEEERWEECVL